MIKNYEWYIARKCFLWEQSITITGSSGLSKDEVTRLVQDAEDNAEEDQLRRDEMETRNSADSLAYNAEKTLREHADLIPQDLKDEVNNGVSSVRAALQEDGMPRVKEEMEILNQAVQKVGTTIYSAQQASAPSADESEEFPNSEGPENDSDETVEGEFREV